MPTQANSNYVVNVCQDAYGRVSTIPEWLAPAVAELELNTDFRYDLLSANLLQAGLVDGSACPAGGLNLDGSANACGIALAREATMVWQNQYDDQILSIAQEYDLSPKLLKALIAVESQFWPASNWQTGEIGLGQMTEMGADLLLTWNQDAYLHFCRQVFGEAGCRDAYHTLNANDQRYLRGFVIHRIDVSCPSCPGGIDAEKDEPSIRIIAETLQASCLQTASLVWEHTGKAPASGMSYEDFWRLVLANYHSGAGCTANAIANIGNGMNWSWQAIANNYTGACASGPVYIRRIEEQIKP
jgi:hypothetical protein